MQGIYTSYSEKELTDLLRSGDQHAYTEIYHRYKRLLFVFAYKRIGDREDARDLIQELFLNLWDKHDTLLITGSLLSYLFTSARNRIIDRFAKQQVAEKYVRKLQVYLDTHHSPTDHAVRQRQLQQLIDNEIAALPIRMRRVFELSRNEHLTRKEIAERLNISEETVKSHLHHALKLLRAKLGLLLFLIFLIR